MSISIFHNIYFGTHSFLVLQSPLLAHQGRIHRVGILQLSIGLGVELLRLAKLIHGHGAVAGLELKGVGGTACKQESDVRFTDLFRAIQERTILVAWSTLLVTARKCCGEP